MLAPNGRVSFALAGADGASLATSGPVGVSAADLGGLLPGGTDATHGGGEDRPFIKSANVTITGIVAVRIDGSFMQVDMTLPATVDVVKLEGGRQITLPDGTLPVGEYDKIVLTIGMAQLVLFNDTKITIDPPGSGWAAVSPLCPPLKIENASTATVSLALEVRNSFIWRNDRFEFAPRFKVPLGCARVPPKTT